MQARASRQLGNGYENQAILHGLLFKTYIID
jgi:hypothetical protein